MTAEVNSAERARRVRLLVEQAMPDALHRGTVAESPEAALAASSEAPAATAAREREVDELRRNPAVQAQLTEFLRQHYRDWVDTGLPALGGKTPRQAMRTRDGREMVEALLVDLERREHSEETPLDPSIIADVRATLQTAIPSRAREG